MFNFQHNKPMSLEVYHPLKQPTSTNLCLTRTTKCSHICVPSPQILHLGSNQSKPLKDHSTTTCLCPRDHVRLDDEARCASKFNKIKVQLQSEIKEGHLIDIAKEEEIVEIVKEEGLNIYLLIAILSSIVIIVLLLLLVGSCFAISTN